MNIECILQCEPGALMDHLTEVDYLPARQISDGTKKWYKCRRCKSVFCLDKMTRKWQFSPETYTDLVSRGVIKDYLNSV